MTQEDIIRMAREAGFVDYELDDYTPSGYDIRYERFATLVAAAEREACAKVAEQHPAYDWAPAVCEIAYAIRARGQA